MATDLRKLMMEGYFRKYLNIGLREDGRKLLEHRDTSIEMRISSVSDGSSMVRIGDMTVLCNIKLNIATPNEDYPKDGFFSANVNLSEMSDAVLDDQDVLDCREEAQEACNVLADIIARSRVLPLEALCIEEGVHCWYVEAGIDVIQYDGNLLGACTIALTAALKDVKMPKTFKNPDEDAQYPIFDFNDMIPLPLTSYPITSSFMIFENKFIQDPTFAEERVNQEKENDNIYQIAVDGQGLLCYSNKSGGESITKERMIEIKKMAQENQIQIMKIIDKAIENCNKK